MLGVQSNEDIYHSRTSKDFYIVNFQEKVYFKITKESKYYDLFIHLYCNDWDFYKEKILSLEIKEIFNVNQLDGGE